MLLIKWNEKVHEKWYRCYGLEGGLLNGIKEILYIQLMEVSLRRF